jgi:hypothetical protein
MINLAKKYTLKDILTKNNNKIQAIIKLSNNMILLLKVLQLLLMWMSLKLIKF